jgi:chromosome segregation ATPase
MNLYNTLVRSEANFYCPHGHQQHYTLGPSEEDRLRQERDRLKQRLAQKDDEIAAACRTIDAEREKRDHERRRVSAAKGQITKLKRRASAGICPCCTRHFTDLERHMASKHPDFTKQPDAADNVVKLKTA